MNGFLIPETEKCDRQIGQQKLTAERLRMWIYDRKIGKHRAVVKTHEEVERMLK